METATVLIVDDHDSNIRLLAGALKECGFFLDIAKHGKQALEKVRNEAPDLILLDIFMPGMDGYEVCRRLKADETTREIPIIFVTAAEEENAIGAEGPRTGNIKGMRYP